MAIDKKKVGILTDKVEEVACSKCGCRIDTSQLESFVRVECPDCENIETVPAKLGAFLLLRLIGTGGMGGVYLARDETLGRNVAIKVMLKSLGEDKSFIETFKREAQAVARLNHPNIAQIYSFGKEKGQPYIVMELVSGEGLDKMLEEQTQLNQGFVLRVTYDIAMGLSAADEAGLVHGDIKPENILLDEKGHAKLVDFGLATVAHQAAEQGIWGTPYYISPEKIKRQKVDARSDIYSLGATLYHVLAGAPPFDGDTPVEVVKARLTVHPPSLRLARPDIHPLVDSMVRRMLQVEPSKRYPNYASLLGDIRKAVHEVGGSSRKTMNIGRSGKHLKLSKKKSSHISSDSGSLSTTGKTPKTAKFKVRKDKSASSRISGQLKVSASEKPAISPQEVAKRQLARQKAKRSVFSVLGIFVAFAVAAGIFGIVSYRSNSRTKERREYFAFTGARKSAVGAYAKLTTSISNVVSMVEKTRLFIEDVAEAVEIVTGEAFVINEDLPDVFIPGVDEEEKPEEPPPEEEAEAEPEEEAEAEPEEAEADAKEEGAAEGDPAEDGKAADKEDESADAEEEEPVEAAPEAELPEEPLEEMPVAEVMPEPDDPIVVAALETVTQVRLLAVYVRKTRPISDDAFADKGGVLRCSGSVAARTYAKKLNSHLKKACLIEQRAKLAYKTAVKSREEVLSLKTGFEEAEAIRKKEEAEETEKARKKEEEIRKQREYEERKTSEVQQAEIVRESLKLKLGQNKFEEAIADIKAQMAGIETEEGKAAFGNLLDRYEYLLGMKTILTWAINKDPFPWGWGAGHSARDILKVTKKGIVVKGRPKPYSWEEVGIGQMLKMVDHYLKSRKVKARKKAQLAFGGAIYCDEFGSEGAKKKAKLYVNRALDNGFPRRVQQRLIPVVW